MNLGPIGLLGVERAGELRGELKKMPSSILTAGDKDKEDSLLWSKLMVKFLFLILGLSVLSLLLLGLFNDELEAFDGSPSDGDDIVDDGELGGNSWSIKPRMRISSGRIKTLVSSNS